MAAMVSEAAQTRLVVLADDPLVRGGLHALVVAVPAVNVLAQVGTDEAQAALEQHHPDLLVWDTGQDPLATLARLPPREAEPPPSVVLLPDERHAGAAAAAGAKGILSREIAAGRLASALSAVLQGFFVADDLFDPEGGAPLRVRTPSGDAPGELTARELEVLGLLAKGISNKQLAARLRISEHTAKFHVNSLLQKLHAQTRTEAVVKAARLGLLIL